MNDINETLIELDEEIQAKEVYISLLPNNGASQAEIDRQNKQLKAMKKQFGKLSSATSKKQELPQLMKQWNAGYLINDNKIALCQASATDKESNPIFSFLSMERFIDRARAATGNFDLFNTYAGNDMVPANYDTQAVKSMFCEMNTVFETDTVTLNNAKWDTKRFWNRADILMRFWITPVDAEPNALFTDLIHSLCGGDQEQMDHLEKWVAFQFLYPEKFSQMPSVDLAGRPGGNGKQIFVMLLQMIFTSQMIVPAQRKELKEGFNVLWQMAKIVCYDEADDKELEQGELKRVTGSTEQSIEAKGVDRQLVDRMFVMLFTSNNAKGCVQLAGTGQNGEDRRWSCINTDIRLAEFLQKKYNDTNLNKIDELLKLIGSRREVGAWLHHIIEKHDVVNMRSLQALHSTAYRARLSDQRDGFTEWFDNAIRKITTLGAIPRTLLYHCFQADNPSAKHKASTFHTRFRELCELRGVEYNEKQAERASYCVDNFGETVDTPQDGERVRFYMFNGTTTPRINIDTFCKSKRIVRENGLNLPAELISDSWGGAITMEMGGVGAADVFDYDNA